MSEWRDIETAPRDGTEFCVVVYGEVTWCQYHKLTDAEFARYCRENDQYPDDAEGWITGQGYFDIDSEDAPAIWQPMPSPPQPNPIKQEKE